MFIFISYMLATGHLNPNEYMASFELGNEIVRDRIQHYSISVNETLSVFNNLIKNTTLEEIVATPNPFNPKTTFKYYLFNKSLVKITIFDMLGSVVSNLGINAINWERIIKFYFYQVVL